MKKISLLLVLVFLISTLAGCGNDQYAKERKFWYTKRQAEAIFQNPLATPPRELERVISVLREFIKEYPDTLMALEQEFVIGRLYLAKEKYDAAKEQCNKIIEKYGQNDNVAAEAVFLIGYSYEKDDKWNVALVEYKKIMDKYPVTGKGLDVPIYIAKHYEKKHEPEKMIAAYKEAIVYYDSLTLKYPGTKLGFAGNNLKAQCYIELKDWESAIGVFNAMIEKYKDKEDLGLVMIKKALIYNRELKDNTKTKEVLQNFIKEYPDSRLIKTATAMLEGLE